MRLFSTDHKVIAKQFLFSGLFFLVLGGVLAMMIRWQWAYPGEPMPVFGLLLRRSGGVITPEGYASVFTMHGLIMIFWAVTPILIGAFGNFAIPLLIGASDMAFPRINAASFWTFAVSMVVLLASFFTELGPASAGWTAYPPLSTNVGTPGSGQTLVLLALFLAGMSTLMGSVNYVTTVLRLRAPGMSWLRLPLTVWGLFLTAVLNVLFVPVLGAATLLLLLDRVAGTQFFVAGAASIAGGGEPILYQHLFWIFGHPEVYILILPAWGLISDILSFFARKPAYWYRGSVYAMVAVTALSALVYGHHMFVTGMSPLLGGGFQALTLIISVPAEVLFLNWLHTLWRGSARLDSPMLFAIGAMFVFGVGGLTGLYLGVVATDLYLHDTMWVVGHFHLTMAAASFLAVMCGIHYWYPRWFGRLLDERLAKLHAVFTTLLLTVVFSGQLLAGYAGQQRRLYNPFGYAWTAELRGLNQWTSYFAFALGLLQLLFAFNFFYSLVRGRIASKNPWSAPTLEWAELSGTPTIYRGPHELSHPLLMKLTGRDFAHQAELIEGAPTDGG